MKKTLFVLLVTMNIFFAFITVVHSSEIIDSGNCGADGDNLTWTLDDKGTLTISGNGAMTNDSYMCAPWYSKSDEIMMVTINKGVTSIGDYAFSNCSSLKSINIPDSVTSIGNNAFLFCSSLNNITIPNSVTSIGNCAFDYCTSLTSISIPENVTSIGDYAFAYCTSLTSISMPENITSISDWMFLSCSSLRSITIPDSVTSIGNSVFSSCTSLESISISNSVTSIGNSAFDLCTSLTSISISENITSIGKNAFFSCRSLTSIGVDINNKNYSSANGVLFDKSKSEIICCPAGITDTSYSIPNSVTSICDYAFAGCRLLTSINMSDSVISIGYGAFSWCTSLISISIPDSTISIGGEAFWRCGSLTSISIPNSVTSIGSYAFVWCESLADVYYDGTEAEWNERIINAGNDYPTNATIHYNSNDNLNNIKLSIEQTSAGVTITNISDYGGEATVIIAKYENDILKYIQSSVAAFNEGERITYPFPDVPYKVFVWDSLSGMKPLNYTDDVE